MHYLDRFRLLHAKDFFKGVITDLIRPQSVIKRASAHECKKVGVCDTQEAPGHMRAGCVLFEEIEHAVLLRKFIGAGITGKFESDTIVELVIIPIQLRLTR